MTKRVGSPPVCESITLILESGCELIIVFLAKQNSPICWFQPWAMEGATLPCCFSYYGYNIQNVKNQDKTGF
jgi:hypothetical protein